MDMRIISVAHHSFLRSTSRSWFEQIPEGDAACVSMAHLCNVQGSGPGVGSICVDVVLMFFLFYLLRLAPSGTLAGA